MTETTVNTPGAGGYLLAWGLSILFFLAAMSWPASVGGDGTTGPGELAAALALLGPLVALLSVPFAVPGILLVHWRCREIPEQRVHVLGAACAGAMSGGFLVLLSPDLVPLMPMLAASTALGRTAVIPLVHERRRRDSLPSAVRC